ncbi:recombinase family protein [Kitasatospora sp. NPDC002040]|uniref:recombinase family protein n=1 Tax=Kitasatospora sp. NPDC002040 TaxID=3154661 RepID=UPI00332EFFEA
MKSTTSAGVCACHGRPQVDLLLRKSKVVREGERALSIRAQEDRGRAWAEENGYCVRKVWRENLSAWSDVKRPQYDAAMTAVLDGEVPCLWVYALDRFSRKGAEAVVPILGRARVIFDYERLDSSEERDRKWIIDRAETAREYSERLSYNVRSTKAKQRNEGRWLSQAPFGVVADPVTRRLRPDTAPYLCLIDGQREVSPWDVVSRIFRKIADGISGRALAKAMNREGLRTVTGAQWNVSQIRRIVIHPVYEGWLTVAHGGSHEPMQYVDTDGQPVRCVEPAVVDQMIPAELAARARRVMSGNQLIPRTRAEGRTAHPLSRRMTCAGCNRAASLSGTSYACTTQKLGGLCPAPVSVSARALLRFVVQQWADQLHNAADDDDVMLAVAERWQALARPEDTQALRDARAELKAAQAKLDKFHADDASGTFYVGRSARYRIPHKVAAEAQMDIAEARIAELSGGGRVDITFLTEGHAAEFWETAAPELRRDLLGLAIDSVVVSKAPRGMGSRFKGSERVSIRWAVSEDARLEAEALTMAA